MTKMPDIDAEQERARRLAQQLTDQRSKKALAAYILELEAEKIRAEQARPPLRRRSI